MVWVVFGSFVLFGSLVCWCDFVAMVNVDKGA